MDEPLDTGFAVVLANPDAVWKDKTVEEITATVSDTSAVAPDDPAPAPETVGLTEEGIQAAKSLVQLPKDLNIHGLAKLAREIAQNIREIHDVLADYKLTQPQFDWLFAYNEFFKKALHAAVIEWNSAQNTQERIKLQAAAGFEDKLPLLLTRMGNAAEGLPAVVEAAKLVAKVAGVGERDVGAAAPGEKFTITINLGADEKLVVGGTKDVTPENSQAARPGSLSTNTEGEGAGQTVSPNAEEPGGASTFRLVTKGSGAPPAL